MQEPDEDDDAVQFRRICVACVGEDYLKTQIVGQGEERVCFYCGDSGYTCSIEELAGEIEEAFDVHYERTPASPEGYEAAIHFDKESDYEWERKGEPALWAIANAARIDELPAEDIRSLLADQYFDREAEEMGDESPFSRDSHYASKDHGCEEFQKKWSEFETSLKTEARYFSRKAQAILAELFGDISKLVAGAGASPVKTVGPGKKIEALFRARIFAAENEKLSEALKFPWKHVGSPPMHAAVAGRMNARGISVFYGALEAETAIAEVRPPVGSQVAVARFEVIRELRLLDLEALKALTVNGSIFDPRFIEEIQRAIFLEILSDRMSRPVMPNEEALEYLPTQAVADYLATEAKLDGIIFPSVQVGRSASNVVLFHHAARVEENQLPKGSEVRASLEEHDEDGAHPAYSVYEEVPPPPTPTPTSATVDEVQALLESRPLNLNVDVRPASLRIDLKSVSVHHIEGVRFTTSEFSVQRHRIEKSTNPHF